MSSTSPTEGQRDRPAIVRAVRWFFCDPDSGRIVVAQWPNAPLWVFIAATGVRLIAHPSGAVGTAVSVVGGVSLAVWAVLEVVRGDSPFRRSLGAVVLAAVVVGALVR